MAGARRCNYRHERPVGREIRSAVGTVRVLYEDKWSASAAASRKLTHRRSRVTGRVSIVLTVQLIHHSSFELKTIQS